MTGEHSHGVHREYLSVAEAVGLDVVGMTEIVEAVLVAGWRDESREPWQIAGDIVTAILDKCLTVPYDVNNGAQDPQTERGNP